MPPETPFSQPKTPGSGPQLFRPALWKKWLIGIGGTVAVLAVGTAIVLSKTKTPEVKPSPSASPAPAVSTSERSKLGDLALGNIQLQVTALTAEDAQFVTL